MYPADSALSADEPSEAVEQGRMVIIGDVVDVPEAGAADYVPGAVATSDRMKNRPAASKSPFRENVML